MSKEEIAHRLKISRESAGFSQDEAGAALGVSYQAISNYERAKNRIDVDSLAILSKLYGVSPTYIITGDKNEGRPDRASLNTLDTEILNKLDSFLESEAVKRHILKYLDLLASETFVLVDGGLTPEEAEILVSRAEESARDRSTDSHKDAG